MTAIEHSRAAALESFEASNTEQQPSPPAEDARAALHTRITPPRAVSMEDVAELWQRRSLFMFFVWREISIRYAQTAIGVLWALVQPLLMMAIFSIVFGRLAKIPSDGVPYPLFALAALVPWFYFSTSLSASSSSLVTNRNLLTKIYFPRLVVPCAPILAGLLDLFIASVLLSLGLLWFAVTPRVEALFVVPFCVAVLLLSVTGVGLLFSALNVRYRDVKYLLPFLIQIWMYASPIAYPSSLVPERYRLLYALNPLVGVVEGFRASLLRSTAIPWSSMCIGLAVSTTLVLLGLLVFRRMEQSFADVI